MINDPLKSIPAVTVPEQETNAAGIVRLRLVPADQLRFIKPERFPRPGHRGYPEFTLSEQHLLFADGASLVDVDVMPDYAFFSEDTETDANGRYFRPTIQLTIPKIRPETTIWLQRYEHVKWVAFLQDRNGFCRCVGTPDQPLIIGFGQATGGKNGRNQTTLTFSTSVEQPAYYMLGIEDSYLIDSTADFNSAFGFEFK
ncbi:hypothetical protein LX87_04106 [Larkinella arboricola]|uniref:Uncharacterized protein n=1 Tax=Larkinella arboricola TaxID=643671 RepID=A0A327WT89_LARAB|nr:hypothetical protein [Larkinella arboricola]RAJ94221.1 hypothetical protein LX87_04106 [Larkinella arboricola]